MSTHDDDTDPTGMRALLRALPDPGPMPDHLVARIQSSIADLSPVDGTHVVEPADRSHEVSPGTSGMGRRDRPSWWARNGSRAAVAAVVLIGGGALASGQLGQLGSGNDSSTMSSDSAARSSGERAESLSGGSGAGAQEDSGTTTDTDGGPVETGPVVVTMSGRRYTAAGLTGQLAGSAGDAPIAPLTAESPGIGPIGTERGVRSCLVALGIPRPAAVEVDLALVDDTPAAVLVVSRDGGRTAYAVGRDCTLGNPALLAGPVDLP